MDNRQERRRRKKIQRQAAAAPARDAALVALLDEAGAALEDGRLEDAAELYEDARAKAPLDAEAFHMLALINYQQGDLRTAGDLMLEAITRDDTNVDMHANCGALMNMLGRPAEAEAACRHVIDMQPRHAEAHNNLAVALEVQGRLDEAAEACRAAIDLRAEYPEAHINLGNIELRGGRAIEALESYAAALAIDPDNAMARTNLSVALRQVGELDAAEDQCRQVIDAHPDHAEAHNALGNVLVLAERTDEAIEAFGRALALQPGYLEARINLAAAQFKGGHLDAAEAAYSDIIGEHEELAEAHAGRGVVLLAAGRLKDAVAAFRRAVALDPKQSDAQYSLASAVGGEMTADEESALQDLADDTARPAAERIGLQFALGEVADQKGRAEEAFRRFKAGNDLALGEAAKIEMTFDPDAFDAHVARIAEVFDGEFLARLAGSGNPTDAPVFVLGMPRSGTTLVEQIAASHRNVHGAGEAGVVLGVLGDYPDEALSLDSDALAPMAASVLGRLSERAGGASRVIDKAPFQWQHLGLIQLLFPGGRIIHCRRDPLDTALSCYTQNFADRHPWSMDLEHIGRYLRSYDRLMDHWKRVCSLPVHEVRYEDLVANQEHESRRLIEFLGLPWEAACLNFHENTRPVMTASSWQVRKPLYASSVGRAEAYSDFLSPLRQLLAN